jgi:iron complex outermembrane receptor protein
VELYARDQWALTPQSSLWLGLRHTRLSRTSLAKDGNPPTDYNQSFTTPWLAVSQRLGEQATVYASWGQGIESTVVPNLPTFANPGRALPALKSRQLEAGLKGDSVDIGWSLVAFDIKRPLATDICAALCERVIDGEQRHRGVEIAGEWRQGNWSLQGSGTALRARREGSTIAAANGLRPPNVPERSLRAQVGYQLPQWPGASLTAAVTYEGPRDVLPDNSATIGSWSRLDLAARVVQRLDTTTLTWRLGVDNVADRRAWKEAPYQFAHAYLFPMPPRTWRASVQAAF